MTDQDKILDQINSYYTNKILTHGPTPLGVDWNSQVSQEVRFKQLTKLINETKDFSLLDYGSGYGALYTFISKQISRRFEYTGYDISKEMTNKGKELHGENDLIMWKNNLVKNIKYDYTIASGIFNVRMKLSDIDWAEYIFDTLNKINVISLKGFSVNFLTSYSDVDYMKDYLYYAQPEEIFTYCKNKFSNQVALLHDYNLYEFTILVRKE